MRPWPDHGQGFGSRFSKGGWVTIKDAVKKPLPKDLPLPAALKSAASAAPVEPVSAEGGEA
jgi:large subunit ribosomal protein L3